ncbi:hypothetical protein, partial [Candidatus Macondimonas diazotrophica]|uniref:hypothetical protein n=1 Tax=Candidatus Macondimonas diazotrophica TaxID=2305248 RepID=UPI00196A8A72
ASLAQRQNRVELSSSSRNGWTIYSADDEEFAAASVEGHAIILDEDGDYGVFFNGDHCNTFSSDAYELSELISRISAATTASSPLWNQVRKDILRDFQFNYADQETYDTLDDVIDTARLMVSEAYYDGPDFENLEDAEKRVILAYIFTLTDYGLKHDDRFPPPLEIPEALILILLSANRQCPLQETD